MNEMIKRDDFQLVGQVMRLQTAHNSNVVDQVQVLAAEHGLLRLRFLDRPRRPVVWIPLSNILELRETDDNTR